MALSNACNGRRLAFMTANVSTGDSRNNRHFHASLPGHGDLDSEPYYPCEQGGQIDP